MANELNIGERRHGSLYVGGSETSDISATIERTDNGLFVSMNWDSEKNPDYGRWFTKDGFFGDYSPGTPNSPAPDLPSSFVFVDSHGPIALIGCRPAGYHTNMFIGTGHIRVGGAILGASNTSYVKINGMFSRVSGLRAWVGTTSVRESWALSSDTARRKITLELEAPDPISIPDSGLVLRPTYRKLTKPGSVEFHDYLQVEHRSANDVSWRSHASAQRALRDLLSISRWRAETLIPEKVMRKDNPMEEVDGSKGTREQWWPVLDPAAPVPMRETTSSAHLIEYQDLGPDGISRWIKLRESFSRAIDPAVSSIYLVNPISEVRLTQIAIALEALGYLVAMRDDGLSEPSANRMNFKSRVDRIILDVDGILPFVDSGWSQRVADTYNAVKHVNRAQPDVVDVTNSWRECALLFRAWVASELGVDHSVLKTRISYDPQLHPYVAVTD